jgi:two-component system cell cycle response regulator DivK
MGSAKERIMGENTILVVEDDEDNLQLVCFVLEEAGYTVLQARDGRHGLALAHEHHPDMVLLDMSIPEMDGWTVARQLKESASSRDILVVALTGHTAPGDRARALAAGCNSYISKPLDIPAFTEQVNQLMAKHKKAT